MEKVSWRHHYLPVFYLKGFSKETGQLKIYDVEEKRFLKNGKEFSPKSYFFEKNANTTVFQENKSDFLEKDYSDFDNKISPLIEKINSNNFVNRHGVTEDDMPILNHFVSLMYWRLPHRKTEIEEIINNNELSSLGLNVHNADGSVNLERAEELKNHPEFKKTFRYFNSLMDSIRGINCRTPYSIIERHEALPFLCSDNPVIFEKEFLPKVYEDDYIFPLSGTRIFLKCNRTKEFDDFLWLLIDTVIYKQAIKYVSCTHEKYVEILEENFIKYKMSVDELKTEIFKRIK